MTNHADDLGYPHCGYCHEDLVRCSACRHYEDGGCRHTRAYTNFTPDLEAAKTCSAFRSRHEVHAPHILANIPAPAWVSLFLLLVIFGLAGAVWFIDPLGRYFLGNPLRLETAIPTQVAVGQPFEVTMRVTNLLNRPSTHIYVEIGKEILAVADPGMPDPRPESISRMRDRILLEYEPLPAGKFEVLHIPFIPRKQGIAKFSAKVYAPINQLRNEVNVPFNVVRDPSVITGSQKKGGRTE
ncbi:MAG: hypothetical protein ACYDBB_06675 [Armatimonadota bacterium]